MRSVVQCQEPFLRQVRIKRAVLVRKTSHLFLAIGLATYKQIIIVVMQTIIKNIINSKEKNAMPLERNDRRKLINELTADALPHIEVWPLYACPQRTLGSCGDSVLPVCH